MSQSAIFASISIFLYYLGFIPYIYHVFHGRVVPHPFSWSIWFIFSVTNLYILIVTTGIEASFYSLLARTFALAVWVFCWWWFIRKISITRFDYFSILMALLVIIFMNLYGMKQAIVAMVITDIIVLLPTLRKIWVDPRTEDAIAWFMTALSQGCLLLSLPFLTFENSFFWFYAICVNLSAGLFIHILRRQREKRFIVRIENLYFKCIESWKRLLH